MAAAPDTPPRPGAADLAAARSELIARTGPDGRGLAPAQLRAALVDLAELWLVARATEIGLGGPGPRTALVAVGALGRRELVPHSDLDLVLLHDGRAGDELAPIADALWYPLWDAGIGLDHAVRTPAEAVRVAAGDLRVALGLLEVRHLAGDPTVTEELLTAARRAWRAGIRGRFDELTAAARSRWDRAGEVAHRVEPDLKNGHGGLRDVQLLDALATAQLIDRPHPDLVGARDHLLDVRTELHRCAGRALDVLRAQDADEVAVALGVADRFALARTVSAAARVIAYSTSTGLRAARGALPRRGLAALRRAPARRGLAEGVVEQAGEVVLARDAAAARDPALLLRVAATAARTGLPIAATTLTRLADTAPELRTPWPAAARAELWSLLGAGPAAVEVVEALERAGLWGRLLPEWAMVRDLPPRDRAHVWTVDRHLVETCVRAAPLTTTVSRPDLLLLGALLHDIGKGRDGDHSVLGAPLAARIAQRLGLPAREVGVLAALVRHHLLLPHTAARRDLDDPATTVRVTDTLLTAVDGDTAAAVLLVELLVALAQADALATGPGVWSAWRQTLVDELAARCRAVLAGAPPPAPGPPDGRAVRLAEQVAADAHPHLLLDQADGGPAAVVVAAPDRPGLLAAAAGVLALHSLEVHAAELSVVLPGAGTGVAAFTFTVSPRFGRLPDPALLRTDLIRVLDGRLAIAAALAGKERDYAPTVAAGEPVVTPRVLWFDDEATGAVVLELRGRDRIGLLHRVAAALEGCGAELRWARVATFGSSVVDAFGLVHPSVTDRAARAAVAAAVLAAAR